MPDFSTLLLLLAGSYLIGSIPVAFLLVSSNYQMDLRKKGSANIGAMNSFEVTGSRALGITIGVLDALKGAAAVMLPFILSVPPPYLPVSHGITLLGVVCGHNYNLWLSITSRRLEGGKGLAAAAGGLLVFMTWLLPAWALLYGLGLLLFEQWRGRRDIIAGNVFATCLLPLPAFLLYNTYGLLLGLGLQLLILPKHARQVINLLKPT